LGGDGTRLLGRRAECVSLDRLLEAALAGRSTVLVLRGEAGVGKSALLSYLTNRAEDWHVASAAGVESEMQLAYSGLHQLCEPMLDHLEQLPQPQRSSLATVFGLSGGPPPDRFLVALATLTLFAGVAERRPLVCVVDDAHWLDDASAQVLGFVARRLLAERIAIVCAARTGIGDTVLTGLPELLIGGLCESDARALLLENVYGLLDAAVCEQIVTESHGNPLALLELPRTWSTAALAGGFGLTESTPMAGRIEQSYTQRLLELPSETRLLVLSAAAEPLGDPVLLHRAAQSLYLNMAVADAAVDAGLLEIAARVKFAHPLVRSAAYRSGTVVDRQRVHRALAEATDPGTDPDRRAWHLAQAAAGPDEDVATELERSADRAQSRGGVAAAAAFLAKAAALTVDPSRRAERALSGAHLKYEAGALQDALSLLATAESGTLDDHGRARLLLLRARVGFASRHTGDALPALLEAARDAEGADLGIARLIYLEAFHAALHTGRLDPAGVKEVSEAVLGLPPSAEPRRPRDLLLDGLATRVAQGYAAGAPILKQAVAAFLGERFLSPEDAHWLFLTFRVASDLWDDESHLAVSARELTRARETGALSAIPRVLATRIVSHCSWGEFEDAAASLDEMRAVSAATGVATHSDGEILLAALRGREEDASRLIEHASTEAAERGEGLELASSEYASAVLYNGLGRYDLALAAVRHAGERPYEIGAATRSVAELVEAAARCGDHDTAVQALERLGEICAASGTAWALGVEARCRALLAEGSAAEELYRESIDRLSRTRLRPELARARLVYGEWLRRERRRIDAREQLRTAHGQLVAIGMEAFTERARRELLATGEKVRRRVDETRGDLTPQEEQIARLARDGFTNPEIGAQLFLSPRTVEWHLRKVFGKLGINSRSGLRSTLPASGRARAPV